MPPSHPPSPLSLPLSIYLSLPPFSLSLSYTQMVELLSLYVMLGVLLSILVCAAANFLCSCLVSIRALCFFIVISWSSWILSSMAIYIRFYLLCGVNLVVSPSIWWIPDGRTHNALNTLFANSSSIRVFDNLSLDAEIDKGIWKAATTLARLTARVWISAKLPVKPKTTMAVYNASVTSTRRMTAIHGLHMAGGQERTHSTWEASTVSWRCHVSCWSPQ